MATPRIDTHWFIGWRGRLHDSVRRIARLSPRPGVSGEAKVMDAWATNPEPIVTSRTFPTLLEADAALTAYRALMNGGTVTTVDPLGRVRSVKVDSVTGEPSWSPLGYYRLVATWTLQVEAAAP